MASHNMEFFRNLPIEIFFVSVAVFGGIARYLNSFINGQPFKVSIFLASAITAGFSGWMFALFGQTLQMHSQMLFIMAGIGGFFGEQSLKFLMDYVTKKK